MRRLVFLVSFFGISQSFADIYWKDVGEYFENQYLTSIYEQNFDQASLSSLTNAFVIYEAEALRGNPDAMMRLAAFYEHASPSQPQKALQWYEAAAAKGNTHAQRRVRMHTKKLTQTSVFSDEVAMCGSLTGLYSILAADDLSDMENLALLGYSECMLGLGRQLKSPYWLNRALLTAKSQKIQGLAAYELTRLQNPLTVLLLQIASQAGNLDALNWFEDAHDFESQQRYVALLNFHNKTDLADCIQNSLQRNTSYTPYKLKTFDFKSTKASHQKKLSEALALLDQSPLAHRLQTVEMLTKLLLSPLTDSLRHSFVDTLLALGPTQSQTALNGVSAFLASPSSNAISHEQRLKLLLDVSEGVKLTQESVTHAALLAQPTLDQMERLLEFRHTLSASLDVSELDNALLKARSVFFGQRELVRTALLKSFNFHTNEVDGVADLTLMQDVLKRTQASQSSDLFLFVGLQLLEGELEQLEHLMRIEDLYFGVKASLVDTSVLSVAQILGEVSKASTTKETQLLECFPKLKLIHTSNLKLPDLKNVSSPLFAQALSRLSWLESAVRNREANGFYFWTYALTSTLSHDQAEGVVRGLQTRSDRLNRRLADFTQNKLHQESTIDAHHAKELNAHLVQAALNLKKQQSHHYLAELVATQKALAAQLSYDAHYTERQAELQKSRGIQMFQRVAGLTQNYLVATSDSKMSAQRVTAPGAVLFSHHSINLKKSEIVEIRVSGEWSPMCAIRNAAQLNKLEDLRVGPEGFRVHLSDGDATVSGHDNRNSTSQFRSSINSQSAGISLTRLLAAGIGVAALLIPGAQPVAVATLAANAAFSAAAASAAAQQVVSSADFSFSAQDSSGTTTSSDKSDFKQESHSRTQTAAFQSGLRLPHAPFPSLPAGAYLAFVVSDEGLKARIIDSFVVQPHTSYLASENSKIYFVVNDCQDDRSQGSLSVTLQILEPAEPALKVIIDTMQNALHVFSEKGRQLANEGGDLSSRIETLKAEVVAQLEMASRADFMAEPTLRSVFSHWLSGESDKIVRQARINDLTKQLKITNFEIDDLERHLSLSDKQDSYLVSRLGGIIRHANHITLLDIQLDVLAYATRFALPFLHLYSREQADLVRKRVAYPEFFSATKHFDFEAAAREVSSLAEQIHDGLVGKEDSTTNYHQVIVRIPRPGTARDQASSLMTITLNEERSKILWDHIFQSDSNGFGMQLKFSDLYQDSAQTKLSATQEAPIIVDMALVFGIRGSSRGEHLKNQMSHISIGLEIGQEFSFPLYAGPKTFLMTNLKPLHCELSVGLASSDRLVADALQHLQSDAARGFSAGKGLSPFTTFSFGQHSRGLIEQFQTQLPANEDGYPDTLTDIVIAFKLASTNQKPMTWIKQ